MKIINKIYQLGYRQRIILFSYFIAILSIAACLYSLNTAKNYYLHNFYTSDRVYIAEKRLSPLRSFLKGQKITGYITDTTDTFNVMLAEHVLVPIIIVQTTSLQYIIGDFYQKDYSLILKSKKLEIVHDFGKGVLLLSHSKK